MDTIEFCYDTVEVENGQNTTSLAPIHASTSSSIIHRSVYMGVDYTDNTEPGKRLKSAWVRGFISFH